MPLWATFLVASGGCWVIWRLFEAISSSAELAEQESARRRGGYVHDLEAGMLSGMFAIAFMVATVVLAIIALTKLPW